MLHPLTDADLETIWLCQRDLSVLSSEFDAFRLYAWMPLDHSLITFWHNTFALRCDVQGEHWYIAPAETEDFTGLIRTLMEYERAAGGKTFRFLYVEQPPAGFPEGFTATPRRDLYDYLYSADALASFQGHAYAAKRNQIAQFKRKYTWRFEPISHANQDVCLAVMDAWDASHTGALLAYERAAVERILSLPANYGQSGGILFANGNPAAFAIGSHPRPSLLDIEVEKALPEYTGAYSSIIQAYTQYAYSLSPFTFVNREEDMGLDNLREAKLQLKPVRLIEKTLMTAPL
ncbi:MAG: phosphatidylglycerol lysyltransferase domain-containing protein [Eubacteriales bacterium]|nr:phosphatidylglycerol lysyltransferase domain-containing protein [Eubacteriales bacterium]